MDLQYAGFIQIIVLLAFVIPAILFLLTQYKILKMIKPENRSIPPGLVWVQLVPAVNLVVQFMVVKGISRSLAKEAAATDTGSFLGISAFSLAEDGRKPTLTMGIVYCLLFVLSTLLSMGRNVYGIDAPLLIQLSSLAAMICWIIYWVQLSGFKTKLYKGFV